MCRAGANGFDVAWSAGAYEGNLQKLIHLFKYSGIYTLARPLGARLVDAFPRSQPIDAITAVPMHWWREWNRGYNQAELLAKEVAHHTGLPFVQPLRRARWSAPQAGLSDHDRRLNLRGAFAVKKPLAGLRLLLVDDVLTTGATVSACSAALKRAGAARVSVLTLARADRRVAESRNSRAMNKTASGG